MMEGKPVCVRCLKTHFVVEACKAEDLERAKAVPRGTYADDPGLSERAAQQNSEVPVDPDPQPAIFSESAAAEKADEELEGTLSVKPGFDRAAYMRERHAKRKRDGEEG